MGASVQGEQVTATHKQFGLLLGRQDGEVDDGAEHDQRDGEDEDYQLLAVLLEDPPAHVVDAENCQGRETICQHLDKQQCYLQSRAGGLPQTSTPSTSSFCLRCLRLRAGLYLQDIGCNIPSSAHLDQQIFKISYCWLKGGESGCWLLVQVLPKTYFKMPPAWAAVTDGCSNCAGILLLQEVDENPAEPQPVCSTTNTEDPSTCLALIQAETWAPPPLFHAHQLHMPIPLCPGSQTGMSSQTAKRLVYQLRLVQTV